MKSNKTRKGNMNELETKVQLNNLLWLIDKIKTELSVVERKLQELGAKHD